MARRRWAASAALVLIGALFAVPVGVGHAAPLTPASIAPRPMVVYPPACNASLAADAPTGTLAVDGGPLAHNSTVISGKRLVYNFYYTQEALDSKNLSLVARGCLPGSRTAVTASNGSFAFPAFWTGLNCSWSPSECLFRAGPYVPIGFSDEGTVPAGYALSSSGGPSQFSVDFVYKLASLGLEPAGPVVTVSTSAPTVLRAEPLMANGSVSPITPTYSWTLNGSGWSFVAPSTAETATVVAAPGAGPATVSVSATATVGKVVYDPPTVRATLVAEPTTVEEAGLARTTVDAGVPIAAAWTATGAAGYAYSSTVTPGLGAAPVAGSCATNASGIGSVELNCTASLIFPSAGIAQPTLRVTNGFSADVWRFPNVLIDPLPTVSVTPARPVGYAGAPVPLVVVAPNGTGTGPYSEACIADAFGPPICDRSAGPVWSFDPTFVTPGNRSFRAWAIDADGENGSAAFTLEVVPPLAVGAIAGNASSSVGVADDLASSIVGGALPLRYWWNASGVSGSVLEGSSAGDGPVTLAFVPSMAGTVTVSLTVEDALGKVVEVRRLLSVSAAPATELVAVDRPPASAVAAGAAFGLAFAAVDGGGVIVPAFAAPAVVALSGAGAGDGVRVNASGIGPVPSLGGGEFAVPAAAWIDGVLTLSLSTTSAGDLAIALEGAALPRGPGPFTVVVDPDTAHLRAYAPEVVIGGTRTNSTFWHVSDRFGNPVPGARLTVRLREAGGSLTTVVASIPAPGGGTGFWVNYSLPGGGTGNVTVEDAAGDVLVGPIEIPAPPAPSRASPLGIAVGAGLAVAAAGGAVVGLRRRARRPTEAAVTDAELRAVAEGRGQVVEIVRGAGAIGIDEIEATWRPSPAPPALADWIASLVADGTLGATVGGDGRARFCLATARPSAPTVTVDPEAFDRGLRDRDAALEDRDGDG